MSYLYIKIGAHLFRWFGCDHFVTLPNWKSISPLFVLSKSPWWSGVNVSHFAIFGPMEQTLLSLERFLFFSFYFLKNHNWGFSLIVFMFLKKGSSLNLFLYYISSYVVAPHMSFFIILFSISWNFERVCLRISF